MNKLQKQMDELGKIKEALVSSPMYNLSLSDKELFHSNFLAWIGKNDKTKPFFVKVIKELSKVDLTKIKSWTVEREDKNFDLCIREEISKNHYKYYLVIENKVKSIPRKNQLDEYKQKIKDNDTKFMLLTLASEFPDKKDIEKEKVWEIKTYKELAVILGKEMDSIQDQYHKSLIGDYIKFITKLNELQDLMIEDFVNQQYYNEKELNIYKEMRIHDLYIKLRASLFVSKLKEKLLNEYNVAEGNVHIMPFPYTDDKIKTRGFKYNDIRPYCKKNKGIHVFLDYAIQQGNGMVAVYIYKQRKCDYIYEIAIQGDQYRHGINSQDKAKGDDPKTLDKLWDAVYKHDKDKDFFNCILDKNNTLPTNGHNKYAPEYVYKYVKINVETVANLMTAMADDIKDVMKNKI